MLMDPRYPVTAYSSEMNPCAGSPTAAIIPIRIYEGTQMPDDTIWFSSSTEELEALGITCNEKPSTDASAEASACEGDWYPDVLRISHSGDSLMARVCNEDGCDADKDSPPVSDGTECAIVKDHDNSGPQAQGFQVVSYSFLHLLCRVPEAH